MKRLLMLAALLLAGCAENHRPDVPEIVRVPVDRYVPLPEDLTRDCLNDDPREQTYAEAKRLALLRGEYLEECTVRMRRIRELGAP